METLIELIQVNYDTLRVSRYSPRTFVINLEQASIILSRMKRQSILVQTIETDCPVAKHLAKENASKSYEQIEWLVV